MFSRLSRNSIVASAVVLERFRGTDTCRGRNADHKCIRLLVCDISYISRHETARLQVKIVPARRCLPGTLPTLTFDPLIRSVSSRTLHSALPLRNIHPSHIRKTMTLIR